MISSTTLKVLLDAGQSNEWLLAVTAAFGADMEHVRELLREQFGTMDAGEPTPAAMRMRKIREKQRLLKAQEVLNGEVAEANTVREQFVTSDNILTLSKGIEKEESKPVVSAREKKKIKYTERFLHFWWAFPTDKLMSKLETFKVWEKLTIEDQDLALYGIAGFKKHIATLGPSYRTVHACRYLSQRRFEGFGIETGNPVSELNQGFRVEAGTDQWDEWETFLLKTTGKKPWLDVKGGRYFPSEFPTPKGEEKAA